MGNNDMPTEKVGTAKVGAMKKRAFKKMKKPPKGKAAKVSGKAAEGGGVATSEAPKAKPKGKGKRAAFAAAFKKVK